MAVDWDLGNTNDLKKKIRRRQFEESVDSGEYEMLLKRLETLENNKVIYRNNILILIQNIAIIGSAIYSIVYLWTH